MNLYSKKEMLLLLEKNGFFFKKSLGQNFLLNENIASRIAASSRETLPGNAPSLALEIGPGAGALTNKLSFLFDKVLALEIDPHLIPVLKESLANHKNVSVLCCDALKFPIDRLTAEYPGYQIAVCSNLPYYITSEILMKLLEGCAPIQSITVLIQREAADRLTASPGSPSYGSITAAVSYYAKAEKLFSVGPGNFLPAPKVDSTVLRLTPHETPPVSPRSEELFFKVIRAAFASRRKTLLNALSVAFKNQFSKERMQMILASCGILPDKRGETLSLSDFCAISDAIFISEEVI